MTQPWGTIALFAAFAFVVLQHMANSRSAPSHLFGILAGICVIISGIGVAAQRSAEIRNDDQFLDKLPPAVQKIVPAYYVRKLFHSPEAYARFNFIAVGLLTIIMGVAITLSSFHF